jgi:hypothetical protein
MDIDRLVQYLYCTVRCTAHTHTNTHTLTQKHSHTNSHTHTLTQTHSHTNSHTHTHLNTLTHKLTHTHSHTHTLTQTHSHTNSHTHSLKHTHTHTHTHTHSLKHTHTQTHTHTHSHTHTLTQTHTHTLTHSTWSIVKKFPKHFDTCRFIAVLSTTPHLSVSWATLIHSKLSHLISSGFILMLSSLYPKVFQVVPFVYDKPTTSLSAIFHCSVRATCLAHHIFIYFPTPVQRAEKYKTRSPSLCCLR